MRLISRSITALLCVLFLAAGPVGTALAHGESGDVDLEHFDEHLDDYEEETAELAAHATRIADHYREHGELGNTLQEFIDHWEEVHIHLVIETQTTPLYPPIWTAISGLREAAGNGAPAAEVERWVERLQGALWQGLGAVKWAAQARGATAAAPSDHGGGESESVEVTMRRIAEGLDQVVAEYRNGDKRAAKKLIHDTYMQQFEGIEGELIEHDPKLVLSLEEDFNGALPRLIDAGAPAEKVQAKVDAMGKDLQRAERLLAEAGESSGKVF